LAEPSLNRVTRETTSTHLTPKAMDLLVYLAHHPGEVLSREAIIDAVWTESFVGENVLRRQIAAIRNALEDDAANPTYIENIPKRGYRLIAEVEFLEQEKPARAEPGTGAAEQAAQPIVSRGGFVCALRWGGDDFMLREGESIIGRVPESQIQIASERVSRRHARITVENGRATIEDLNSKNGTWVDGQRIDGPAELVDGDQITIGPAALLYCGFFTAETKADDSAD
jgi:DNA-binding winged helix-turn-helix (wHTH) protein